VFDVDADGEAVLVADGGSDGCGAGCEVGCVRWREAEEGVVAGTEEGEDVFLAADFDPAGVFVGLFELVAEGPVRCGGGDEEVRCVVRAGETMVVGGREAALGRWWEEVGGVFSVGPAGFVRLGKSGWDVGPPCSIV
jgi:hypothetical protein